MEKVILFLLALLIPMGLAATAHAAKGTPATPTAVTFFYNMAMVTVEGRQAPEALPDGGRGFRIQLPAMADPSSLNVSVNGVPAAIFWPEDPELGPFTGSFMGWPSSNANTLGISPQSFLTFLPEEENDPDRKKLLETLAALQRDEAAVSGRVKAAEASLALWQKGFTEGSTARPEDFAAMETLVREHIPALQASLQKENIALREVSRKIQEARQYLEKYDSLHRVRIAHVQVDGAPGSGQAVLRYTYILGADSAPSYQVNASPDKGELRIGQAATMTLHAGIDWKNVEVSLAFLVRGKALTPGIPSPWILDYATDKSAKYSMRTHASPSAPMLMEAEMADAAGGANYTAARARTVEQEELSTFRLWKLGAYDITGGEPLQAILASDVYKANFYYTVRPTMDRNGFLTADLEFAEPVEMPLGMAVCSIDGVYAGAQNFSLNGKKGTVFLGPDPQVTVRVNDLEKKRGSQGFISTEQTRVWHWELTVANTRSRDIAVRVEEPEPVSRDKTIKISVNSSPRPEIVTPDDENADSALKLLVWKKALKPGESFTINHKVEVAATSGKLLNSIR